MKKIKTSVIRILVVSVSLMIFANSMISSCSSTSQMSAQKGGAVLWGQNCIRCHNTPSPSTFSDQEWDVAVSHMQVRALLTKEEAERIVAFLKTAN